MHVNLTIGKEYCFISILFSESPSCQLEGEGEKKIWASYLGLKKQTIWKSINAPFFYQLSCSTHSLKRIWCQKAKEDSIPAHCSDSLRGGIKHFFGKSKFRYIKFIKRWSQYFLQVCLIVNHKHWSFVLLF